MNNLTFSDVCNIISKLDTIETDNYNKHIQINPNDEQRKHDHITINTTYCTVLQAIHDHIGDKES